VAPILKRPVLAITFIALELESVGLGSIGLTAARNLPLSDIDRAFAAKISL
jgi:hypothetical protein